MATPLIEKPEFLNKRDRGVTAQWRRPTLAQLGVLFGGLAALWFVIAVTVDEVLGAVAPTAAAAWGLPSAGVDAAQALALAQPGASAANLARARKLAAQSLRRDPTNVAGARAFGQAVALQGSIAGADRMFAYAEKLSRRDLGTQLWMIDEDVRRGDIVGAIVHYDRALRVTRAARPILFPILVKAVDNPAILQALTPAIARRPDWAVDFLANLALSRPSSPDALARLLIAARLRPNVVAERAALDVGLAGLVDAGAYRAAFAVHRQATGGSRPTLVRDGDFDIEPALPPFDWTFAESSDLSAIREARGGGHALALRTTDGVSGEFARQLLLLPTGRYRLRVVTSGVAGDPITRPRVSVSCAQDKAILSEAIAASSGSGETSVTADFSVRPNCVSQWLVIAAPTGLAATTGESVYIDAVSIVPVEGSGERPDRR